MIGLCGPNCLLSIRTYIRYVRTSVNVEYVRRGESYWGMTKGDKLRALKARLPKGENSYRAISERGGWEGDGSGVQRYFHPDFEGDVHYTVACKLRKALVGLGNPPITTKEVNEALGRLNESAMSGQPQSGMFDEPPEGEADEMHNNPVYRSAVRILQKLPIDARLEAYLESIEGTEASKSPGDRRQSP